MCPVTQSEFLFGGTCNSLCDCIARNVAKTCPPKALASADSEAQADCKCQYDYLRDHCKPPKPQANSGASLTVRMDLTDEEKHSAAFKQVCACMRRRRLGMRPRGWRPKLRSLDGVWDACGGRWWCGIDTVRINVATSGAFIRVVFSGSSAERAGLASGDVVVLCNGTTIHDTRDITGILSVNIENRTCSSVGVLRDGAALTIDARLLRQPAYEPSGNHVSEYRNGVARIANSGQYFLIAMRRLGVDRDATFSLGKETISRIAKRLFRNQSDEFDVCYQSLKIEV